MKVKKCLDCPARIDVGGSGGWRKKRCTECQKKHAKELHGEWREGHPGRKKELDKNWVLKNPEKMWAIHTRAGHAHEGFDMENIPIDYLENLAKKTRACRYCGGPIDCVYYQGHRMNGPALDRTDNKEGVLLPEDVQIICYRCSCRKGERTDKEFREHLEGKGKIRFMGVFHEQNYLQE
jgi:hypothetical protein